MVKRGASGLTTRNGAGEASNRRVKAWPAPVRAVSADGVSFTATCPRASMPARPQSIDHHNGCALNRSLDSKHYANAGRDQARAAATFMFDKIDEMTGHASHGTIRTIRHACQNIR